MHGALKGQDEVPIDPRASSTGMETMTTRVLIVDDEESMRTLLRSWVEREGGSTVIEAATAEALPLAA